VNTPRVGVHETGYLVFMKPSVGGGDESQDSNATPKTTTAGPMGRQFRERTEVLVPHWRDKSAVRHFFGTLSSYCSSPKDLSDRRSCGPSHHSPDLATCRAAFGSRARFGLLGHLRPEASHPVQVVGRDREAEQDRDLVRRSEFTLTDCRIPIGPGRARIRLRRARRQGFARASRGRACARGEGRFSPSRGATRG
jgi:hypothetical protein